MASKQATVASALVILCLIVLSSGGGFITVACYWNPRASPLRCTTALARRTPPNSSSIFIGLLISSINRQIT
ncbi:hypothetical protein COLO4_30378 [Corchorus olitorius]|uniref:Uncharacterized protein n=1 Tax=Corchorus olitorius TaxID=93759 RepID=A0A1R3H8U1_9ROSI|nr:hypothetical protein COLO4_30378 [Corchorus olitorius]